jgi:hypothetical protein
VSDLRISTTSPRYASRKLACGVATCTPTVLPANARSRASSAACSTPSIRSNWALQLALEGGQIAALEHGEIGGHRCMLAENWISFVRSSVIGIPAMMAS